MRTAFGPEGDIRSTDVLAALVALWRENASGTLRFSRSGATSGFELSAGEILGASSSDPRFDTAAILVRAGKLEASTLERLVVPEGADRAHSALQAGILTKREWRWGEKIRAVEVLSDLLTWIEGDYSFYRKPPREAGEFRLTIPRLVLELFLRSRDRTLVLHYLGGVDVPLVRDGRFETEFSTFGLTDDAESVVRLIDGESTAAEIAAEAPAEAFAVEKLLAALATLGLVHPAYAVDPGGEAEGAANDAATRRIATLEATTPPPRPPDAGDEETAAGGASEDIEGELEPEVDIEEKLEAAPPPPPAPEYDALEEESPAEEAEEELVDADLEGPGAKDADAALEDPEETESERLASDFVAARNAAPIFDARNAAPTFDAEDAAPILDASEAAADEYTRVEAEETFSETPVPEEPAGTPYDFQRPLDTSTGVGSLERPRHRSSATLLVILGLLVAATAAVVYWRARGADGPGEPSPVAAALPSPTASETMVEAPSAAPTAAAAMPPPAAPVVPTLAPSPRPTARPASTARPVPTAAPRTASSAAAGARPRSRQDWLERAERDQKAAAAARDARFTVQLELACEVPSLTEAYAHDRPAGSMWVVPTSFRGRTCFRVLWGRYATREAAESGLAGAPAFFSTPRNHPMVVAIRDTRR